MSSFQVARRGGLTALTVFATAVLLLVGFAPGSASAADVTSGKATFNLTSGKAGKVSAVNPAKVAKRFGKKGAKVTSAAKNGSFGTKVSTGLAGGIRFASGKRKVAITGLSANVFGKKTVVRGKLRGKTINVFNAFGNATINLDGKTAKVSQAKLSLSNNAAGQIRKALKLKKAPKGKLGTLSLFVKVTSDEPVDPCELDPNAEGCPIVDPYLAQCDVAATNKVTGSLPAPAPLPTLANPESVTSLDSIGWGLKTSFRSYVIFGAQGSMHGLDGATTVGGPPVISGFDFPVTSAEYSDNGTGILEDDQAVVETSGTAVFCATAHNFRVAVSDPTFVIDGDDSRIIATVDTNLTGVWTQPQRIDLADLKLGEITQSTATEGTTVDWGQIAASFTQNGADAICGTGEQAACNYSAGTELDPVALSINTANAMPVDQYNAQCGVPVASVVSNSWPTVSALPTLSGAVAAAGNSIDWGFKATFRGYVFGAPPAGSFQALNGASRSPGMDPTRGFSYPIADAEYAVNTGVAEDDQAIVNGTGTGLYCKSGHGFWVSISDPTIVIDGENSRLVATVSQNTYGPSMDQPWQTPQRIDLADLDLSSVTPTYGTGTVTWTAIPATVSDEAGSIAGSYTSGTELDPITVSLETE